VNTKSKKDTAASVIRRSFAITEFIAVIAVYVIREVGRLAFSQLQTALPAVADMLDLILAQTI